MRSSGYLAWSESKIGGCAKVLRFARMSAVMNTRWLFWGSALLLLLVFRTGALAGEGEYLKTMDGKTLVWDNYPAPGDSAEWSGERDKEGYATGYGTIIWYRPTKSGYTFVNKSRPTVVGRYSGTMVKGKFEGVVVKIGTGNKITWQPMTKDSHATFVGGKQTSDWVAGPAPDSSPEQGNAPGKKKG
jgi:hypothetical protein